MSLKSLVPVLGVALGVAACSEPETGPQFRSDLERACYEQASAVLGPGRELRRGQNGAFVEVLLVNGFARDVDPSETFNACMISRNDPVQPSLSDLGTITFSGDEQRIWDSLSDERKRAALEFIQKGGTLTEFASS